MIVPRHGSGAEDETPAAPTTPSTPTARVIADSVTPDGSRLTTIEATIHRFVLAELNTHRTMCLAGSTELWFDLPSAVEEGTRRLHRMTLEDFHDRWHVGTTHVRAKKGRYDLSRLDPASLYTTGQLAAVIGAYGHSTIVTACRRGGLPHQRVGREYRVSGRDFLEWYGTPPSVAYPLMDRLGRMHLRCLDEESHEMTWTHVADVWESGVKETYEVTLEDGKVITCSKDHLFMTEQGWATLEEATGLRVSSNGIVSWDAQATRVAVNGMPAYRDADWLQQRVDEGFSSTDIAAMTGATVDQVKRQRAKLGIRPNLRAQRRRAGVRPWNKGRRYAKPEAADAAKRARVPTGAAHHWWRGGISSERELIGRWTQSIAPAVHERNGHRCVICADQRDLRCHHVDPVARNPERARDESNLTTLCERCHTDIHSRNLEVQFLELFQAGAPLCDFWQGREEVRAPRPDWKSRARGNTTVRRWVRIAGIRAAGAQMTYDLRVRGPWHNFVADGVVVHNSRNSASSRAIPAAKQLQRVLEDPALPLEFGVNQPGMQAAEVLGDADTQLATALWLRARDAAHSAASQLVALGVHKQVVNRLLEPFLWHTVIVSATDWQGFWEQRCSPLAQPEIRAAAEAMRAAQQASVPIEISPGDWHTPYIRPDEQDLPLAVRKRVSAARCARVSYLTHDGRRDVTADEELYDRLVRAEPPHWSPLEHVARPSSEGDPPLGNFRGWRQLRHDVERARYAEREPRGDSVDGSG